MNDLLEAQNTLLQGSLIKAQSDLEILKKQYAERTDFIEETVPEKEDKIDYNKYYLNFKQKLNIELLEYTVQSLHSYDFTTIKSLNTSTFVPIPLYIEQINKKEQLLLEEKYTNSVTEKHKLQQEYEQKALNVENYYHEKLLKQKKEISLLNSQIQDLKGNIRVYVRIRPKLKNELENERALTVLEDEKSLALSDGKSFKFDHIFNEIDTQENVYMEISGLIKNCIDGFNICVFAYGATGSGKTHTMEGEAKKRNGLIHQAVRQIFSEQSDNMSTILKVKACFFEIYNEQIYDLLRSGVQKSLDLRLNRVDNGADDVYISDLIEKEVSSEQDLVPLFNLAAKNRSVGETQSNIRSSRSHSVFRLKIDSFDEQTKKTYSSTLNLIDLAGSERLQQSGAQGERLKETQNINKSLSHLGLVIQALHNREAHIPYRNSKLTHVLSSVLGGTAKVLMFVNVASTEEQISESICSLRFAAMVNNVSLGVVQRKGK